MIIELIAHRKYIRGAHKTMIDSSVFTKCINYEYGMLMKNLVLRFENLHFRKLFQIL